MQCPKCSADNPGTRKFCRECGDQLFLFCPQCNAKNLPNDKYCGECGQKLGEQQISKSVDYSKPKSYTPKHLADKILNNRSAIEGERKLVTVFFADVANYTAMSEKLDPEIVHQIMDGVFKIIMEEIHGLGGTINQFTGDGVMALFGAPAAIEDHAQRACRAALAIQSKLVGYGEIIDRDFKMRIGLNSGYVVVGAIGDDLRMDYTAVGDTTNLAARIQQAANPGEVWISEDTHNIVKGYFDEEPLGEVPLKGKCAPQAVHRITAERTGIRTRFEAGLQRGITNLVGRKPEMDAICSAFKKAAKGEAQLVDIVGEAGVGKSRLVYEFSKALDDKTLFLSGICIDHGRNINFLPLIDIVRGIFKIPGEMSEEEAKNNILDIATGDLTGMIPFYQSLLSYQVNDPNFAMIQPEGRKYGSFEATKKLLFRFSEKATLVIFVEDVHWIDKFSEEFLTYFTRHFHDHQILIIANYRPEFTSPWTQVKNYQKIFLETLSSVSSAKIISNILGGSQIETDIENKIVEKTGGNPFFMEEIVRALLDRGDIAKEGKQYKSNKPIDSLIIPSTVQGVLSARMDRLSEDLKNTMQVASVIGRDFTFRILKKTMSLEKELREHLTKLVEFYIICEKALYPDIEYSFTHALTQEVAYESLLIQRRKSIHERIARTIEELYTRHLEEYYELIAYHYDRSDNFKKAIEYLALAGEKSNSVNAVQIAYECFDKALKKIDRYNVSMDGVTLAKIHQGMAEVCFQMGSLGRTVTECQKALILARKYELIDIESKILFNLAFTMHMYADKVEARKILIDCLNRSRELGSKSLEGWILSMTGMLDAIEGNPGQGYALIIKAYKLVMESDDFTFQMIVRIVMSCTVRWIGQPRKVIELTEGLYELLYQGLDITTLTYLISWRGIALAEIGRIEDSMNLIKNGIDTCEQYGAVMRLPILYNSLGYCYSEICIPQKALNLNRKAGRIAQSLIEKYPMGIQQFSETYAQSMINVMDNLFDMGKIDEAWVLLENLKEESASENFDYGRQYWELRMNYLECKMHLENSNFDKAELIIQDNIERANKNQMKKREGSFLRLLGEIQLQKDELNNAVGTLKNSIGILEKVSNPKLLWETYSILATIYQKLGRSSKSSEAWGAARNWITTVADDLSDMELKNSFLNSQQIKNIFLKCDHS